MNEASVIDRPYLGKVNQKQIKYLLLLVVLVALVPIFTKDIFYLHLGSLIFLSAANAVGWNLIARSGQFSFGTAGFWAIGAYTSALLTTRLGLPFFLGFALGGLLSGIVSVSLGTVFVRASGIFFTLLTFVAAESIRLFTINFPSVTFGIDGVPGIQPPSIPVIGLSITSKAGFYWLNFFFALLVVIFCTTVNRSFWGRILEAVRDNPLLAECTGIHTRWYKILAFGIGCTIAGFSGSLFAHFLTYISPSTFTFWRSIDMVLMNVLGGINSIAGPIIGAFIVSPLPEFLRGFVAYQVALYGLILVVVVRFVPGGIVSLFQFLKVLHKPTNDRRQIKQELMPVSDQDETRDQFSADTWSQLGRTEIQKKSFQGNEALQVNNITKNFGGLAAVNDVSFIVKQGEILGIIGPNGAGKTTLFNLLSGVFRPDKGRVLLGEENITGLSPHTVSRHGLVRTFQATTCYTGATVWENVLRGYNSRLGVSFWGSLIMTRKRMKNYIETCRRVDLLLNLLGLNLVSGELPSGLPYGQQRQLQLAIALATEPEIILLDEPISGMNPTEIANMAEIIKRVRDLGITVVVVEHNMNFVMNLCERIVVLDHGMKIAEGTPEEIRCNPVVIEAYLGAEDAT